MALGGVKSITIHDDEPVTVHDLGAQFFLRADDVGKSRADASVVRLAELNNYVPISVHHGAITPELLENFQVVVLTNCPHEEQVAIGDVCHAKGIKLIVASTLGLFGFVNALLF